MTTGLTSFMLSITSSAGTTCPLSVVECHNLTVNDYGLDIERSGTGPSILRVMCFGGAQKMRCGRFGTFERSESVQQQNSVLDPFHPQWILLAVDSQFLRNLKQRAGTWIQTPSYSRSIRVHRPPVMAGRNWQTNGARSKPPYTGILQIRQTIVKTHENFVSRLTTKNYSFDSTPFHGLLPRWKFPRETHGKWRKIES
jgi:hypothetical protein